MKVLDLCSGLGGFSEAFQEDGHDVLRIEKNPLLSDVAATKIMCLFEFEDWLEEHYVNPQSMGSLLASSRFKSIDLIVFSPPCTEFSTAYSAPRAIHHRGPGDDEYEPSLELLECGMRIIKMLKPKYWIVENVRGSIKFFKEELGDPRQINDAYVFWGNFPAFVPLPFPSKAEKDERWSPLRANIRGKIPIEISEALLHAVKNQTSIFDY